MSLIAENCGKCKGFLSESSRFTTSESGLVCLNCESSLIRSNYLNIPDLIKDRISLPVPFRKGFSKEYFYEAETILFKIAQSVIFSFLLIMFIRHILLGPLSSWINNIYIITHLLMIPIACTLAGLTFHTISQLITMLQGNILVNDVGITKIRNGKSIRSISWNSIHSVSETALNSGLKIANSNKEIIEIPCFINEFFEISQTIIERSSIKGDRVKIDKGLKGHSKFFVTLVLTFFLVVLSFAFFWYTKSFAFLLPVVLWAPIFLWRHFRNYIKTTQMIELTASGVIYKSTFGKKEINFESIKDVYLVTEQTPLEDRFTKFSQVLYIVCDNEFIRYDKANFEFYSTLKERIGN